jgi:FMN phosphatase YigB (HAD superfamily)
MRVSFDIDDTLVLRDAQAVSESGLLPAWVMRRACEPLRAGSKSLFRELKAQGCEVWIYTSSLRSTFQIRYWLALHGLWVDGIVNDDLHRRKIEELNLEKMPSKYPPAFGIDLHVDDSPGVELEGRQLGFSVIVIGQQDSDWTQKVITAVNVR